MKQYFQRTISVAPLVIFRIGLGIMLFLGTIRFWLNGWIESLYITPKYFFPYYGFDFVVPLGSSTYMLFFVCGISALFVALGFFYRLSSIILFLSFTYIELIDKTTYLNHYYFISLICFLMMFLPAHVYFSVDAYRKEHIRANAIPQWCIDSIKLLICIIYVCAGIAKINSDWLLNALPLKMWLPARNDMPIIGFLFNYTWVYFVFSWFGCLYDLSIPFFLWNKRTRIIAYLFVVVFHVLTSILFPIGMFPYIMIVTALIFFSPSFHERIITYIIDLLPRFSKSIVTNQTYLYDNLKQGFVLGIFFTFFAFQFIMPFRYLLYPGQLFWTEEGFRFSWRVMLIEKTGYTQFTVKDETGKYILVNNNKFLTGQQEKMMSTQPDMMLQYAHILADYYALHGFEKPSVYVDAYVALNGRIGKNMIDTRVDLAQEKESLCHKSWIINYNE
jgi:hypothetical protein